MVAHCSQHRSGFVLVMTLLLVTLLTATTAALALNLMAESTTTAWVARDLDHRLAVDSLAYCLPELLSKAAVLGQVGNQRAAERRVELTVGRCEVRCIVQEESNKLHIADDTVSTLDRLRELARSNGLPPQNIALRPTVPTDDQSVPRFVWFDQIVSPTGVEEMFRRRHVEDEMQRDRRAWSDLVSFWSAYADGPLSLQVETQVGSDVRHWYIIVELNGNKTRVLYQCSV